jgi:hypothetical protein
MLQISGFLLKCVLPSGEVAAVHCVLDTRRLLIVEGQGK